MEDKMVKKKGFKCYFCKEKIEEKGLNLVDAFLIEFSKCSQFGDDGGSSVCVEYDYMICRKCYKKYAKPIIKELERL